MNDVADDAALAAAAEIPDDEKLAGLRDLALAHLHQLRAIEQQELRLQNMKAAAREMAEKTLPERLSALGMTAVPMKNGAVLELKPFAAASIAPENREVAFAWFRAQGLEDLIKHEVVVSFGRGEDKLADMLCAELQKLGRPFEDKRSVHAQTLSAFVRRRLEAGEKIDTPAIDVYAGQHVKLKLPPKKTLADVLGS